MARGGGGGCCPPMDLMRSEAMQLVQVIIPTESAHLTVSYLGELGLLQLKDVSPYIRYPRRFGGCSWLTNSPREGGGFGVVPVPIVSI